MSAAKVTKVTKSEAENYFLAFVVYLDRERKTFVMMFVPPNKDVGMRVRCTLKYNDKGEGPFYKLTTGNTSSLELTAESEEVFIAKAKVIFEKFLKREFE